MPDQSAVRRGVFLDRDGAIAEEIGYLNHASRFRIFPLAAAAICRLDKTNFPVMVVTNQFGVGRSYFPESLVNTVNELMTRRLAEAGATIDAVYYCPHPSTANCNCRKPRTGMVDRAALEHGLDLRRSFVVGDRYDDVELARNVRSRSIRVRTAYGEGGLAWNAANWPAQPDFIADDLSMQQTGS